MFRHRRHVRSRGGKRRKSRWGSAMGQNILGTVPAATVLFDAFWIKVPADVDNTLAGQQEPEDWTLTRSLLNYEISCHTTSDNFFHFFLAAGILVWTGRDDAPPNPLTVPYPVFDGDADWVWTGIHAAGLHSGPAIFIAPDTISDLTIQSRAMRKLSSKQGLLLVIGADNSLGETGITDVTWSWNSRHHFKLP